MIFLFLECFLVDFFRVRRLLIKEAFNSHWSRLDLYLKVFSDFGRVSNLSASFSTLCSNFFTVFRRFLSLLLLASECVEAAEDDSDRVSEPEPEPDVDGISSTLMAL